MEMASSRPGCGVLSAGRLPGSHTVTIGVPGALFDTLPRAANPVTDT